MGQQRIDNLLLESLPQPYRNAFCSRLEEAALPPGAVLYEAEEVPRYAWFVTSGLVSKMVSTADGRSAEISMAGNEGVLPCYHLLGGTPKGPVRCVVQMTVRAFRISFPELRREVHNVEPLRQLIMKCAQRRALILSQVAACNRLHDAQQRLARWLLTARDLTRTDSVLLSQGYLADILGARRTTVTLAAGALRRRRLISYSRGHIQILDYEKLRTAACECYGAIRSLLQNFYA